MSRLDEVSREDPALGGMRALMAAFQAGAVSAQLAVQRTLEELGSRLDAEGVARPTQG